MTHCKILIYVFVKFSFNMFWMPDLFQVHCYCFCVTAMNYPPNRWHIVVLIQVYLCPHLTNTAAVLQTMYFMCLSSHCTQHRLLSHILHRWLVVVCLQVYLCHHLTNTAAVLETMCNSPVSLKPMYTAQVVIIHITQKACYCVTVYVGVCVLKSA